MKIRLYSDLHLEFGNFKIPKRDGDKNEVLVLAGDIGVKRLQRGFIEQACKQFHSVIYVLGNHEYYNNDMEEVLSFWHQLGDSIPNLYVLENEVVEIDGVRFLGTTLWSDLNYGEPGLVRRLDGSINDFFVIKNKGSLLTTSVVMDMHRQAIDFLSTELAREYDGKTVVVTHFSPSHHFIVDMFKGSDLSGYFNANCDKLFMKYNIDFWLFGHTHHSWGEQYGTTWCYSNQKGYARYEKEKMTRFNKYMEIDTENPKSLI